MVLDLVDWPRFFVKAAMSLVFCLAFGKVVLMMTDVAVGFFELFLW